MTTATNNLTTVKDAVPRRSVSIHSASTIAPRIFPYPKWWSWTERGTLFVLSACYLGLVIWLIIVADHIGETPWSRLIPGLLGGMLGVFANGLSLILLMRDKYGPKGYWIWNVLWDVVMAGCCVAGFAVAIEIEARQTSRSTRVQPALKMGTDALMWMSLILGVLHFAANVAGFYGIHLVNKRGRVPGAAEHDDLDV